MVIKCPGCQAALAQIEYEPGATVLWCNQCLGIWIDGSGLYKILKEDFQGFPLVKTNGSKACPKCGNQTFHPVKYPETDVMIDLCGSCHGIWFDMGELQTIKEAIQKKNPASAGTPETASEKVASWINRAISTLLTRF